MMTPLTESQETEINSLRQVLFGPAPREQARDELRIMRLTQLTRIANALSAIAEKLKEV